MGGSSAGSYLGDPTSHIPSHCTVIILFKSVPVHKLLQCFKSYILSLRVVPTWKQFFLAIAPVRWRCGEMVNGRSSIAVPYPYDVEFLCAFPDCEKFFGKKTFMEMTHS